MVDVAVAEGVSVGAGVLVDTVGTGVAVRGEIDARHPNKNSDSKTHIKRVWLVFISRDCTLHLPQPA